MKAFLRQLLGFFLLCTGVGYTAGSENLCNEPDHLLSYNFTSIIRMSGTVSLYDQFIGSASAFVSFNITGGIQLLNPATKFHEGEIYTPERPDTHYLGISLATPTGATPPTLPSDLQLLVRSQFGQLNLTAADFVNTNPTPGGPVQPSLELLVPSVKKTCNDGDCSVCDDCFPEGDHYLCYALNIQEPMCLAASARFEDEFIENRRAEDLIPSMLCNPVDKMYNGITTYANQIETNHLLCYTLSNKSISPRSVYLLNQLGEQQGVITMNNEVCVPSTKIDMTPPQVACGDAAVPMCNGACAIDERCIDNDGSCTCANCSLRRVFATSIEYTGDLGSVNCANEKCQQLATAAGLSGTYLAWISDSPAPGSDGLSPATNPAWDRSTCRPFYLVDGTTLIANNWADLIDGTLDHPIDQDEFGHCIAGGIAWTNTASNGNAGVLSESCPDTWTSRSSNDEGQVGLILATDATWTSFNALTCNNLARLYCFEQ